MLKTLRVHNFKSFLNTELKFGQTLLLLGKNNSGKTNLAKLLQFISLTAGTELDRALIEIPGGAEEICNWNLKSDEIDISCICALDFDNSPHVFTYELRLNRSSSSRQQFATQPGLRVVNERLSVSI